MGLFDFLKKNDLDLIEWQNIIQHKDYNRLLMSKSQLNQTTQNIYLPNTYRIIADCVNLIENTVNPDTFFTRIDLLIDKLTELAKLEKFITFHEPRPSKQLNELISGKENLHKQFIDRYWNYSLKTCSKLKTAKGQQNKLDKCFNTIEGYKNYLSKNNIEYLYSLNYKSNNFQVVE